ncbi:U3 small nucleolar RNA-associated protein 6 [Aphis craccivora]|uniref:U3 small nucleolar RNA-associated protein 6 n=1 Tax=Aphis craccivora TaxID=307492 RepID=A0A6G0ZH18_APHCR|nr:U3 small nucleolar RNA-associated protein 6 [Aphis craccivora]
MDFESEFLKTYRILKWDEFTVLNNDRMSINEKITNKVITKHELLLQFKAELSLLNACKNKIKEELEKGLDVIDTQVLVLISKRVIDLFDHMHVLFSIDEQLLFYYINFCQDNVSYIHVDQLDILLDAVLCTENNQKIWIRLLRLYMELNSFDKLMNVFQEGVRSLKNNSLPLWKMMSRFMQNRRPDMIETLFEEGSNISYENISFYIRAKYLKWCLEYKDIDATRNLFNELKQLKPPCYKLYLINIAIETETTDLELSTVRKLYDEACTLFGRDNIGIWLDYIRFEQTDGSPKLIESIYTRGLWKLEPNLRNFFIDEYDNIKREFMKDLGKEVIVIDD